MTITQTVEIPINRRLIIDVPREVPTGTVILTWQSPLDKPIPKQDHKPISRYFGIISPDTYGDGVAYQRKLRDEWDG